MSFVLVLGAILACFIGLVLVYKSKTSKAVMKMPSVDYDSFTPSYKRNLLVNGKETAKRDEVIIVGAGVAGSALAYALGKEGRQVHVFERDMNEPNRIVGEILQLGGYLKLKEMGLDDCLEEIDAQPVLGYALIRKGKTTTLPYPDKYIHQNLSGKSFHHGRFVQKMRQKAASLPNVKFEQATVTSVVKINGVVKGVTYKTSNDNDQEMTAFASLTIVSDGCFSNLRRFLSSAKVKVPSNFLGFILENCELPCDKYAHIVLADPSPIWLYSISSNEVRCNIDLQSSKDHPSISNGQMGHYLKTVVAPEVPSTMRDAFIASIDKGIQIRKMQNGSMRAAPYDTPGALLIGDALNMRHPFSGGGMTVALSDVHIICKLLRPLGDLSDTFTTWKSLEPFYTLRKPLANSIDVLATALYGVYCATNGPAMKEMQQVIFNYLSLGGIFKRGLVEIISGINPVSPWLIPHFFGMIMYCFFFVFLPFPTPRRIQTAVQLLSDVTKFVLHRIKR